MIPRVSRHHIFRKPRLISLFLPMKMTKRIMGKVALVLGTSLPRLFMESSMTKILGTLLRRPTSYPQCFEDFSCHMTRVKWRFFQQTSETRHKLLQLMCSRKRRKTSSLRYFEIRRFTGQISNVCCS